MAGANDPSLVETPEYRIVVLFLGFILLTYSYEKGTHWLDHYLKKKNRRGLLHTIHKLQEELLALGLITLMLIAIEEYLVQICVDSSGSKKGKEKGEKKKAETKAKSKDATEEPASVDEAMAPVLEAELNGTITNGSDDASSPEKSPFVEVLAVSPSEDEGLPTDAVLNPDDIGNRKLLGLAMRTLLAGGGGEDVCPSGQESFWSIRAIHETHIFIFVLASVHIVFAGVSMVVCSWKVHQWRQWEENAMQNLKRVEVGNVLNQDNCCLHYLQAFFFQFHQHIDESMYLGLRRLFIERMELDSSFRFHEFLVNSMEEEFSKVVKIDWVMWVVAAIWIWTDVIVVYIMTGIGVFLTLLAGTKLEYIALKLGNEAYMYYADKPPPGAQSQGNVITRNLKRLSMSFGSKRQSAQNTIKTGGGQEKNQFFDSADYNHKGGPVAEGWEAAYDVPAAGPSRDSNESGAGHDSVISVNRGGSPEISGADLNHSVYASPQAMRMPNGEPVSFASSDVNPDARQQARMGNNVYDRLVSAKNRAATAAASGESVGCLDWLLGWCCNDSTYTAQLKSMRRNTFSDSYIPEDSAHLFPFRRPRLMLTVFQYTYFETSLHMAILLFNLWQVDPDDEQFIIPSNWDIHWLVFVGIFVMLLTSILILPVYWLTMVTGSHCPSKVLKKAGKKNVKPKAVRALERASMSLRKTSANLARTSAGLNRPSTGLNRPSMGLNRTSAGLDRPSMGLNRPSMGLNRTSVGLQRVSIGVSSNPSVDGAKASTYPQHWAELEETAREVKAVDEEESKAPPSTGALGMLVAGMLKTKRKELDKVSDMDRTTPSPPPEEPPALSRKSKPLLGRISLPLIGLPSKKEAAAPQSDPSEARDRASDSARSAHLTNGVPGTNSGTTPRTLSLGSGAAAGLQDIEELATPKEDSGALLRKSKSDGRLNEQDAQAEPDSPKSTDSSRPSLARTSMPMVKLLDMKQKAYLARERQMADYMMQESPEEEAAAHVQNPPEAPTAGLGHGEQENTPVWKVEGRHPSGSGGRTAAGGSDRAKVPSASSESDTAGSAGAPSVPPSGTSSRPTLDYVAELFKLGEKRKQERE